MESFLERLFLEVVAIALQLAILRIVGWLRRPAVGGVAIA